MSIDNSRVVDVIGIDKTTGEAVLTISDHLDWSNESEHLALLQDKVNTYISFVESGEILEKYPDAYGKRVTINVVGKYQPSPNAVRAFLKIRDIVEPLGMGFHFANIDVFKLKSGMPKGG